MSDHKSVHDLPEGGEHFDQKKVGGLKMIFGIIGLVCLAVTWWRMFRSDGSGVASYSYLFAFSFFFTIGIGGLFWTILHHATNSGWGISVRRQFENVAALLPWLMVLIFPFFIPNVREKLWEWDKEARVTLHEFEHHESEVAEAGGTTETQKILDAQAEKLGLLTQEKERFDRLKQEAESDGVSTPGDVAHFQTLADDFQARIDKFNAAALDETGAHHKALHDHFHHKHQALLAHKWFGYFDWSYLRLGIYIFTFVLLVWLLRYWSIRNDFLGSDKLFTRMRYWSCFFLVPFAVCFTFLVFDFYMSLDYKWFSTMWGVYLFAGSALNSMAVIIIAITWLRSMGYLKDVVSEEHYHLMGKLMFAFVVFWAYISFSQYFLIWYANITEETQYFLLRNSGGWRDLNVFLVVGHFIAPFIVLLWRGVKKRPGVLAAVAGWNLVMHFVDLYLVVIPERGPSLSAIHHLGEAQLWVGGFKAFLMDLIAFAGVGCTLIFIFLKNLSRSSLYPCRDPRLEESINVVN